MANRRDPAGNIDSVRYVSLGELMQYTALGRATAERLAREAGARHKIGAGPRGRVIYDLNKIDSYIGRK